MTRLFLTILTVALVPLILPHAVQSADRRPSRAQYLMYVGTYTEKNSKGIYAFRYDTKSGEITSLGLAAESANPSFLAVHPSGKFLYAVNEVTEYHNQNSGAVSAFAIDASTGHLNLLNEVPSRGADPCYLAFDQTGRHIFVANYTGGNVAVFPVKADGRLAEASSFVQHQGSSVNRERQEGPHAHSIDPSPDNRFAVAADLGLDELLIYRFDADSGAITPTRTSLAKVAAGAGPRHFSFHPNGRFAYALNELHSNVTVFSFQTSDGNLRELQTISMLPAGFTGRHEAAEVQVHPSGKFLYASDRGPDTISVFGIDKQRGTLTWIENVKTGGKEPRNFVIDPTGTRLFAANQNSDTIQMFQIDQKTGKLTATNTVLQVPSPVVIRFVPIQP